MEVLDLKPKLLIFGWYHHGNLGDEWFKEAFTALFPDYSLTFTNFLSDIGILTHDVLIIGGGSFLDQKPPIANKTLSGTAVNKLHTMPLFFLGVGAETSIHPFYQELMQRADLIVLRTSVNLEVVKLLNPNVLVASDLVYSICHQTITTQPQPKSILMLANVHCLFVPLLT